MAVIQAIISVFAVDDDLVRSLTTTTTTAATAAAGAGAGATTGTGLAAAAGVGGAADAAVVTGGGEVVRFVFEVREPLYLVAVSGDGEDEVELRRQLGYLHDQIVFNLTQTQLTRIFEERVNFDLRQLLTGTDVFLDELANAFATTPAYFLEAVQYVRMPHRLRQVIGSVLAANAPKSLLYAILLSSRHPIAAARRKRHALHARDVLLLTHLIHTSAASFRSVEVWTPVCLPAFNGGGFVHAYVCLLSPPDLWIVLVSVVKDAFFEMSELRARIVKDLDAAGCVEALDEAIAGGQVPMLDVGIPGLRHFLCRSKTLQQYVEPTLAPPYTDPAEYKRLLLMYQNASARLSSSSAGSVATEGSSLGGVGPTKFVFMSNAFESVVAWTSPALDIYAAFSPLVAKSAAMTMLVGLQRWIKGNETALFGAANAAPFLAPSTASASASSSGAAGGAGE